MRYKLIHHSLTLLMAGSLLALLLVACSEPGTSRETDTTGSDSNSGDDTSVKDCVPGDGECPAIGDDIEGDWVITQPRYVVQPGTIIELEARNVDAGDDDVVFHLDDGTRMAPFTVQILEEGADPATTADDVFLIEAVVPYVIPGPATLALGTPDRVRSGRAVLEVVMPTDIPLQGEVANDLRDGLLQWTDVLGALLESTDPSDMLVVESFGEGGRERAETLVASMREIAELVHDDYMALTPEEHAIAWVLLRNTGALEGITGSLDGMGASGGLSLPLGVGASGFVSLREIMLHPIHSALYELDFAVMALNVLDGVLNVVEAIAIITEVGAPVGAAVGMIDIALTAFRLFVDSFVPTDLVSIEAANQPTVVVDEGAMWSIWGTFESEKDFAAGGLEAAITLSLKLAVKVVPGVGGKFDGEFEAMGDLVAQTLARITPDLTSAFEVEGGRVRLKTIINVTVYELTLGDLVVVVPLLGSIVAILKHVVDFVVSDPFAFAEGAPLPDWASDAEVHYGYDGDAMTVTGVEFPDGVEEFTTQVVLHAYAWKTQPVDDVVPWFLQWAPADVPDWENVTSENFVLTVRSRPEEGASITDEDFVIQKVKFEDGSERDKLLVWSDSGIVRDYDLELRETNLDSFFPGPTIVQVRVNGDVVCDNIEFQIDPAVVETCTLPLNPGRNEFEVVALQERSNTENTMLWPVQVALEFPDVANVNTVRTLYGGVGDVWTYTVWAPPAPPSGQ